MQCALVWEYGMEGDGSQNQLSFCVQQYLTVDRLWIFYSTFIHVVLHCCQLLKIVLHINPPICQK